MLYIFWFLHQTTTLAAIYDDDARCISFDSYIKPQRNSLRTLSEARCISFESYIKPQLIDHVAEAESSCISFESYIKPQHSAGIVISRHCCISFESYIKPQRQCCLHRQGSVVYLLNPTSNHNPAAGTSLSPWLYIFWILHQTTTLRHLVWFYTQLYIFWIQHQTTTRLNM